MKLQDFDFRIWDNFHKKYHNKADYVALRMFKGCKLEVIASYENFDKFCKDCEIELYTGFKDKNGVKIFEGDILEYELCLEKISLNEKCCARVVFESGCFKCVTSIKNKFDLNTFAEIDKVKGFDKLEVIGNIHENKDLL